MQKLILHRSTGAILREDIDGKGAQNEHEDAWDYDGPPITIGKPYQKRDPQTGQIVPATTRDIIESGVGDADRVLAKSEFIAAIQQLRADSVVGARMARLLNAMEDFYKNYTL